MKKVFSIIVLIVSLTVVISGCKKFLDIDPPYTQDAENYFQNESEYLNALTGAYDLLQGIFVSYWIGDIASDNCIAGGESVTDTEGLHQIDNMTHGAVNNELRNLMRWNYCGIARCNFILEPKEADIEFASKATILAEAKFLRAFYYFELVKVFGDMPLIIDKRIGIEEVLASQRTPANEVYDQIEKDLEEAIAVLSYKSESSHSGIKGRVDKGAAMALLGKVHLYQQDYPSADQYFSLLIASGNYALIDDYSTLFYESTENNSETVFDVEFSSDQGGDYGCLICLEGNVTVGFQGIRAYEGANYGDGNSYNLPTQDLYSSFEPYDPRREATCLNIDLFIAENSPGSTYAIGGGGHTGYYNNKYIKSSSEMANLGDNDLTSGVNYRVIRYADILLMAAEARNNLGDNLKALDYLNLVRVRVGLFPKSFTTPEKLLQDILKERRSELSCEGHRFFDLVRIGIAYPNMTGYDAEAEIDGFTVGKHELFPIPQDEIDLAGGNWIQNQGY